MAVKIGQKVPDFEAEVYQDGKFSKIKSSDYKGIRKEYLKLPVFMD